MHSIVPVLRIFPVILLTFLSAPLRAQTDPHQHDGPDHDHDQTPAPVEVVTDFQPNMLPEVKSAVPFQLSKQYFPSGKFTPAALDQFIAKVGKDSLIRLLDTAIARSSMMLENKRSGRLDKLVSLELMLVDRQFKLGIDPYMSVYDDVSGIIIKLYGKKFGIPKDLQAMIDTLASQNLDMYDEFVRDLSKEDSRYGLAVFGDELLVSDRMLDTLYRFAPNVQTPIDRIRYYWVFAELCRDQKVPNPVAVTYRQQLFATLYKDYNAGLLLKSKQDTSHTNTYKIDQFNVASLLAYGLYGGEVTLAKHGADILFLLSTMDENGGWHRQVTPTYGADINLTAYGIWALAEAREKLKTYDPPKQ